MRILGIDPGFGRLGYGIIEQTKTREWQAVAYGCIETDPKDSFVERLKDIHTAVTDLVKTYHPTRLAVEELFFFKNITTAIQVAQARGVVLLAGIEHDLAIDEFTPLEVKQSVTGYGRADKGQMQKIVATILKLKQPVKSDDAADALAIALTAGQALWLKNHELRIKK